MVMPPATDMEVPKIKRPRIFGVLISAEYTPTGALDKPMAIPIEIEEEVLFARSSNTKKVA